MWSCFKELHVETRTFITVYNNKIIKSVSHTSRNTTMAWECIFLINDSHNNKQKNDVLLVILYLSVLTNSVATEHNVICQDVRVIIYTVNAVISTTANAKKNVSLPPSSLAASYSHFMILKPHHSTHCISIHTPPPHLILP